MEQDTTDRIEAYLNNTLTKSELLIFENELKENSDLNQAVQEHIFAMQVVDKEEEKSLQNKFTQWDAESKGVRLNTIWLIGLAASVLLIIGSFYLFLKKEETRIQIAQSFYNIPDAPSSSMGTVNANWIQGLDAYRSNNYIEAAKSWNEIPDPNPETMYFLAHSYFNIQDFEQSGLLFQQLSTGTSVFSYPSDWYLALAYLAAANTSAYSSQINRILADPKHPYFKDAGKLEQKLLHISDK